MVWDSHLFQNFPQFAVVHTLKGFGIVNKADVFRELSCFFDDPEDVASKDGEALYSQQKQDRELTVPQIMNSLLPNSELN